MLNKKFLQSGTMVKGMVRHCEEDKVRRGNPANKSWILSHSLRMTSVRSTVTNLVTYCPSALVSCKNSTPHPSPLPAGEREHLAAWLPSCLAAFTLSEVLITLGIIGVVAAVTMPTLIQKHREKVTVTQLKKAYSVLSQAMVSAVNENGTADLWDSYEDNDVNRFSPNNIINKLVISKNCGFRSEGCWESGVYKALRGTDERDFETLNYYYKVVLSDGTLVAIEGYTTTGACVSGGSCGEIWVDLNGRKGPNVLAKDLFIFVYDKNRIFPYGYNTTNLSLSATQCKSNGYGYDCTAWVLANENMDYLHCDDLSWVGKTKCSDK